MAKCQLCISLWAEIVGTRNRPYYSTVNVPVHTICFSIYIQKMYTDDKWGRWSPRTRQEYSFSWALLEKNNAPWSKIRFSNPNWAEFWLEIYHSGRLNEWEGTGPLCMMYAFWKDVATGHTNLPTTMANAPGMAVIGCPGEKWPKGLINGDSCTERYRWIQRGGAFSIENLWMWLKPYLPKVHNTSKSMQSDQEKWVEHKELQGYKSSNMWKCDYKLHWVLFPFTVKVCKLCCVTYDLPVKKIVTRFHWVLIHGPVQSCSFRTYRSSTHQRFSKCASETFCAHVSAHSEWAYYGVWKGASSYCWPISVDFRSHVKENLITANVWSLWSLSGSSAFRTSMFMTSFSWKKQSHLSHQSHTTMHRRFGHLPEHAIKSATKRNFKKAIPVFPRMHDTSTTSSKPLQQYAHTKYQSSNPCIPQRKGEKLYMTGENATASSIKMNIEKTDSMTTHQH